MLTASFCPAAVLYVEGEPGMPDLSDDETAPTQLVLAHGGNEVAGLVFDADPDFFTVIVPEGALLTSVNLLSYGHRFAPNLSLIAYQSGLTLDRPSADFEPDEIAHRLFGRAELDEALFEIQLPAGPHAFWVNETSATGASYRLNFVTTPVPEPSSALFLFTALFFPRRKRLIS